jgi:hypothetical protein
LVAGITLQDRKSYFMADYDSALKKWIAAGNQT